MTWTFSVADRLIAWVAALWVVQRSNVAVMIRVHQLEDLLQGIPCGRGERSTVSACSGALEASVLSGSGKLDLAKENISTYSCADRTFLSLTSLHAYVLQ